MAEASDFQKAYLENQKKLQRDIRPMIARSGQYNPEGDIPYEYQHYPRWVEVGNRKVVVHNADEENALLGKVTQPAKAVNVDITNIVQEPTVVPVKRGRPPKVKPLDLPADLK